MYKHKATNNYDKCINVCFACLCMCGAAIGHGIAAGAGIGAGIVAGAGIGTLPGTTASCGHGTEAMVMLGCAFGSGNGAATCSAASVAAPCCCKSVLLSLYAACVPLILVSL